MPENLPLAVMILIWLMCGVITFGWLLMQYAVWPSLIFALLYFGLPVLIYRVAMASMT